MAEVTVWGGIQELRPSGNELFVAMSSEKQDAAIGADAAALVRDGEADLKDFIAHSKLDSDQPDWITQRPVEDVAT